MTKTITKLMHNGTEYQISAEGGGGGETQSTIDLLVIGGGGSGSGGGGGGGAGGFVEKFGYNIEVGCGYSVVVGLGGGTHHYGGSGLYSQFGDLIALGGGSGTTNTQYSCLGGSGGGGHCGTGVAAGGPSVIGQGCDGGCGSYAGGGGGGGGAGQRGCDYGSNRGGNGGDGKCSCMSGECVWYAGGGGGFSNYQRYPTCGGCGGGGNVICDSNYNTLLGQDGCCCGAGGGSGTSNGSRPSGKGAPGIVIARYKTDGSMGINCATGGCVYCCGDYTIHCFTSNGTFCVVC